ncbi:hypothetical protein AX17_001366 [Amanita inopinata Kibby_2008]|nr:hypothetical protein AX17_001366 [Amanita inopinata Kibby_2008]
MNPQDPASFNHRTEHLSTGRTYHFIDQKPDVIHDRLTILCVHGFPDSWYGWRYQIGPWVRKGARVIVPDMLGYGDTDKPKDPIEYSTKKLCDDLAALLDLLAIERTVVVGHDWGAYTAARFALWHPNRLLALAILSVPYTPPSPVYLPIQEVARRAPNLGYQVYFADNRSTKEIEIHLGKFISLLFSSPTSKIDFTLKGLMEKFLREEARVESPLVLNEKEKSYYVAQLAKGMEGPLNYYRTSKHRHDEELAAKLPSTLRSDLPVLFMWGTADPTTTPFLINKSRRFISRLEVVAFEGKGHWVMVEAKDEVTDVLQSSHTPGFACKDIRSLPLLSPSSFTPMDPQNPDSFNHRTERLSTGRTYHFIDQQPAGYDAKRNLALLCLHGLPDSWYGWRYQIGPWVRKGARVVVPDMLGYGGTDNPRDPSEYSPKKLCDDLAALLDLLKVKKVVIIGHDWGAFAGGRFALWYPTRILALVMMSVPYTPPSTTYIPIEEIAKRAPNLGFQVYFASKRSTQEIESNLEKFVDIVFRSPTSRIDFTSSGELESLLKQGEISRYPSVLNEKERAFYIRELSKGMEGVLNYCRTTKYRHEEELGLPSNLRPDLPVLFLWGTADATTTSFVIEKSHKFIARLQDVALEGKGHWVMLEAKDDVTEMVANWLQGLSSSHPHGKL